MIKHFLDDQRDIKKGRNAMKKKKRVLNKRKVRLVAVLAIAFILLVTVIYLVFFSRPVRKKVKVEAGVVVDETAFVKSKKKTGQFKEPLPKDVFNHVGTHTVVVIVNEKEYESELQVKDTVDPTGAPVEIDGWTKHDYPPESFVKDIVDQTDVTVTFEDDFDQTKACDKNINLVLTDEGENKTVVKAHVVLKEDNEAPVIDGTKNMTVMKGDTIAYKKGVTVKDNADDVKLEVDASSVNLNKYGTYKVTYQATDVSGNNTTKKITVKVVKKSQIPATMEQINKQCDPILKEIIKDGMTQRQKCKAIYTWVKRHVGYVNHSDKSSWKKGAMHGFLYRSGDCFNHWAVTKALLMRAGIKNMDLSANTKARHYWNFVKVEGGWYHLDTTPRSDHPNLCLRTDAWVTSYSKRHRLCFKWNQKNKPKSGK